MGFDPTVKLTRENVKSLPPLCTDGAWGTEMAKQGGGDPGWTAAGDKDINVMTDRNVFLVGDGCCHGGNWGVWGGGMMRLGRHASRHASPCFWRRGVAVRARWFDAAVTKHKIPPARVFSIDAAGYFCRQAGEMSAWMPGGLAMGTWRAPAGQRQPATV